MIRTKFGWQMPSPFILLSIFLVLVFLTGGSARGDVASLVFLRPVAVLFFGLGLLTLSGDQLGAYRFAFCMLAAMFALVALQLVPLPYEVWTMLPGRSLLAEIDAAAGVGRLWRPISMVPQGTENAIFSLFVPAAVLCLGAQLSRSELFKLVHLVLWLAILSGLLGLLQAIGNSSALYLYKVTNFGSAVGLFANRNHQALLLAMTFPLLAVYASLGVRSPEQASVRKWMAFAFGLALVPLLLVTGSRAGLVLGGIAILLAAIVFRSPDITLSPKRRADNRWRVYGLAAFGVVGMVSLAAMLSRSEALDRLISPDKLEQDRLAFWPVVWGMVSTYVPFGSGFGSFAEVYQIFEPDSLLQPNYLNHAHNDYLEFFLTGGFPALIILIFVILMFCFRAKILFYSNKNYENSMTLSRLGGSIIFLILISSFVDYPIRTPIISSIFVVSTIWFFRFNTERAK